jgi:glycosyltransferase involved in cell wall biosynthesis
VVPVHAARYHLDVLHGLVNVLPLLTRVPRVVTVHDLAFLRHPERFRRSRASYLRPAVSMSVRRADHIIAISASTRADLLELLGVAPDRVTVIYPGVAERFRPLPAEEVKEFRTRELGGRRYILHVGTLEPRKNIDLLIRAFAGAAEAAHPDLDLVLAGARGWMYAPLFALVRELGLESRVHFLDHVTASELPLWYNAADLFAYPSAYEGFGLPVAEAMACGVPTITSSSSSLIEVTAGAGLAVETGSLESLRMALARVLDTPHLAGELRRRGLERARIFTWPAAARATARVYELVHGGVRL